MISAWSARRNLVLGQAKVADKSNEIVAIPRLLDLLVIQGATVTIDAMGCQREIAKKITDKGADYVLALKGNQGSLRDDTELFFTEQATREFADAVVSRYETLEKSHGRIETRTTWATDDIAWLKQRHMAEATGPQTSPPDSSGVPSETSRTAWNRAIRIGS